MVPADAGPVIGIDEARLEPVTLAMQQDPSLIVLGDAKKGKTTFLRALARELIRGKTPDEVRILAIDLRRNLLGEIPEEFLVAYLSVRDTAVSEINDLTGYLQGRLPGPDVTAEQLRNRSWWRRLRILVSTSCSRAASAEPCAPCTNRSCRRSAICPRRASCCPVTPMRGRC